MAHLCSSPASFAGRLDLICDGKGNSGVRLEAGLDFGTTFTRGCTTRAAILNRAAKGVALLSDDALVAGINLDRPCSTFRLYEKAMGWTCTQEYPFSMV
ncbi:MAG: hypothetical protein DMG60_19455 [Acidobacteria bacterium]|nr:MAG: hypothetical protein DMG60_19455 [Acidobacteriota bacterium]